MNNCALIRGTLTYVGFCLICSFNLAAANATVRGTVVDADGKPVSHASVEVRPVLSQFSEGVVGNTPNPWIAADQSGHFELVLAPGRYKIQGKDEEDGFPDPTFWLNVDPKARFPVISVDNKDVADVVVVLGSRGGVLYGSVQDADTRTPIFNAKLRLQDVRNSYAYVDIFTNHAGQFQYAVPSKPIVISVTAPGYKTTAVEAGAEVTLSPGERRQIDIELRHE